MCFFSIETDFIYVVVIVAWSNALTIMQAMMGHTSEIQANLRVNLQRARLSEIQAINKSGDPIKDSIISSLKISCRIKPNTLTVY